MSHHATESDTTTYDPLRLCVFATIALLGWLLGPVALLGFAALGFAGYWKAWRGGLSVRAACSATPGSCSRYLAALAVAGAAGIWFWVT